MWPRPFFPLDLPRVLMTVPSAVSELLIALASLRDWPVAPDLAMRSDPARSIRFSLPLILPSVGDSPEI
jgi:hypothetical protein